MTVAVQGVAEFNEAVAEFNEASRRRTRLVLERRAAGVTLKRIGEEIGVSANRVRQIEVKGQRMLASLRRDPVGW